MERGQCIRMIQRIVDRLEAGRLPVRVLELYAFGSFARGSLNPGDLDLIICHKELPNGGRTKKASEAFAQGDFRRAYRLADAHKAKLRRALIKPGERVDILFGTSLEEAIRSTRVSLDDTRLLWSQRRPNLEANLRRMPVDDTASRASRPEIIPGRRIGGSLEAVEEITQMLARDELALTRIPVTELAVELKAYYQHWLEWWTECNAMGKQALKCLPYALLWLQNERASGLHVDGTTIKNKTYTRRVHIGNVALGRMRWYFGRFRRMRRQCLIPFIKRGQQNELLVFERGTRWRSSNDAKTIEPYNPTSN